MTTPQKAFTLLLLAFLALPGAAHAQSSPIVSFGQGQVNATTTHTSNGIVDEYQVYVGNGHSGPVTSVTTALQIGSDGSPTENAFANAFGVTVSQASTSIQVGNADASCTFQASSTDFASGSGFPAGSGFLQFRHVVNETNGGCTLRPDYYTSVSLDFYRSHFANSYHSDFSYGSVTNNQGWNWAGANFTGMDCAHYWNGVAFQDFCYSEGPAGTGFYPNFSVLAGGFILQPNYGALATTTCDIGNISGCFQNALVWAFSPPSGSLDTVSNLWSQISHKPPFGYFTVTQGDISALGASTSPTFVLGQVSGITTYIFDPIDTALAALWWAIFGVWFFFNRLRHIQI